MSNPCVTWVYAAVPGDTGPPATGTVGVAGEPVRLVVHDEVAAAVGSVSRSEFGEQSLRRHLEDPVVLENTARSHHRVVSTLFHDAPTVPFRLATVYHDDARVRELLARRREELRAALDTVARRAEWGVQAFAVAPGPAPVESSPAGDDAGPGTAYLLRRRAERSTREQARREALESAHQVHSALERVAEAARHWPPPPRALHPDQQGSLVLNAAYLVDEAGSDGLVETTRALADRYPDLQLRVTGPWPAYSFVEIGQDRP